MLSCCMIIWFWVQARLWTRSAMCTSWYLSISSMAAALVSAMPVTKFTLAVSPGSIVTLHRMETIGSKTSPSLSESSIAPVIATGSATVLPLPMNLERSVSKETSSPTIFSAAIKCSIQGVFSSFDLGRRVHRMADLLRTISVSTKRLLKAG